MTKARFEALRKFSCVECGRRPVDIAHSNFSEHGKGKGYLGQTRFNQNLRGKIWGAVLLILSACSV